MKTIEEKNKKVPLMARILDPVEEYYFHCSQGTRKNIIAISRVLVFTVTVCGAILAASLCKFVFQENYLFFPFLLIACCLFYFLIDRPIVFTSHQNQWGRKARILIAIILGFFNSFLIDSYWFSQDIEAARQSKIKNLATIIKGNYDKKLKALEEHKVNLLNAIDSLNSVLNIRRQVLDAELEGKSNTRKIGQGPVWKAKYQSYLADSLIILGSVHLKQAGISDINTQLSLEKATMEDELSELPSQIGKGINQNLEILHQTILLEGNFTNIFACFITLMVTMILELIPFQSKASYNVDEYFEIANNDKKAMASQSEVSNQIRIELEHIKSIFHSNRSQQNMAFEDGLTGMKIKLSNDRQILGEMEEQLNLLAASEERLRNQYPSFYDSHILPAFKEAYDNLKSSTEKALTHSF